VSFPVFDLWDQAQLTDVITRPAEGRSDLVTEDNAFYGETIAPFKTFAGDVAKIRVRETKPFGKGQFRAPDATPPLFKPAVTWQETLVELVLQDEMERINETDWKKLNSSDEDIRRSQGLELVERGRILETRNRRLAEWMRWQAFQGVLVVTYPTGDKVQIDYGLPAGHKPTAGTLWTDLTNSDPVSDLQAWAQLIADDSGFYGVNAHMTSKTFNYMTLNTKIRNQINFYSPSAPTIQRPREQDIMAILSSYTGDFNIVRYNNGFRDVGASGYGAGGLTKYLPDGFVLLTTNYTLDGHNIADVLDGQVTVSSNWNEVQIRQGFQTEVMLDHMSKTHFFRAASARIPRILIPEAIVWAKVA
jgi:Phage major capsid protein E